MYLRDRNRCADALLVNGVVSGGVGGVVSNGCRRRRGVRVVGSLGRFVVSVDRWQLLEYVRTQVLEFSYLLLVFFIWVEGPMLSHHGDRVVGDNIMLTRSSSLCLYVKDSLAEKNENQLFGAPRDARNL